MTEDSAESLGQTLDRINAAGVPVIVRFAHEMNGTGMPGASSRAPM